MVNARKTEDQHNTPEQIGGYVLQAVKIADGAELSEADRAVLLPTILSLVSAKQVFYEQIAPTMAIPGNARH